MKLRHVFLILGGVAVALILLMASTVVKYQANAYRFLGNAAPKKVVVEPDRVGLVGREARYYVIHKSPAAVVSQAESELTAVGWTRLQNDPALFGRGPHERIDVREASQYSDKQLLAGIPSAELTSYSVVKVVDPRMPPAIRGRIARWARHHLHALKHLV